MKNKFSILSFVVFAIFLFSYCSDNKLPALENDVEKVYYFDFDEVDHYNIRISESDLYELSDDTQNKKNVLKVELLQDNIPRDISDTGFVAKLEKMGFEKTDVPASKNEDLNELFREKGQDPNRLYSMCMPIYRDILVFRKNGAISGIAKICFECDLEHIVGTAVKTSNFGSFETHRKLSALLFN